MGLIKKFKTEMKSAFSADDPSFPAQQQQQSQKPLSDQPADIQEPSPLDVLRYRYQHGANLGSVFVLEKWLTSSMYQENADSAELAAVSGNIKAMGLDAAREKFEKHWETYISDSDMDWLANQAHCTSVRLPIGYFTLGPAYCEDTPFKSSAAVYQNAWPAVKRLVSRLASKGIGTLLDFHALPGGANNGDHSGTNSGKAELWRSKKNLDLAARCLLFIAHEARSMDGVIGIQLINEAEWDASGMYGWYDYVIGQIGGIDNTIPLYISDGWNLGPAVGYINKKNSLHAGRANPIIIDTHLYWAFSDADKKKHPNEIANEARSKLSELDGHEGNVVEHGAAQVVVGEYSCVLTEDSWAKAAGHEKEHLVREFGQAQTQRYQQRTGGSFFWTYKMDWMDGGEWGFKEQTLKGAITAPHNLSLSNEDIMSRISQAQSQVDTKCGQTYGGHCNYWDSNHPGQYEHWRFESGWKLGFNDAMTFFGMRASGRMPGTGGDKIGMLDIWVKKRIVESGQAGQCLWEFESGLRQGIRDFYELAGV